MRNLLSRRKVTEHTRRVLLDAAWYVDADARYSIHKKRGVVLSAYTAVRTLTGAGELTLRDESHFTLAANSLAVFPSGEIAHYCAAKDGWQFYWFEFECDPQPDELMNTAHDVSLSAQERIELERCFSSLGRSDVQECMLADALFGYLLAGWQVRINDARTDGMSPQRIVALLEKGRRERTSIAELARLAGMCERSFRDATREATGLSPKAYMLKGEMAAAMELLRTSSMSVSEISACFQYTSPFYFSRVFKKYYGVSPQQVRKAIDL